MLQLFPMRVKIFSNYSFQYIKITRQHNVKKCKCEPWFTNELEVMLIPIFVRRLQKWANPTLYKDWKNKCISTFTPILCINVAERLINPAQAPAFAHVMSS